jgi:hypothetical protein
VSVEAICHVWNAPGVTAEERLMLLWVANSSGGLGLPVMIDPHDMGKFICADYYRAVEILEDLSGKNLIRFGTEEEQTASYVWLTYDGPYESPIDWTRETKTRSKRVAALIERDGPKCSYCDCTPVAYEVDHFEPKARGGADTLDNLVLACRPCNRAKRDKPPEVFLKDNPRRFYVLSTNLKYLHE